MWDTVLSVSIIVVLVFVNALGVILCALQLPGTWLIVLSTGLAAAWWWDGWSGGVLGGNTLVAILALAVLGEIVETVASVAGASRVGSSRRGAALSILGGIIGAIAGTFLIPIPIVGTLVGAALGAGVATILGDLWAGREWGLAVKAGSGAAVGRFAGAVGKLAIAIVMWLWVCLAMLI